MTNWILIFTVFLSIQSFAQADSLKNEFAESTIFVNPEIYPEYEGGEKALRDFIYSNIQNPSHQCLSGKVYVGFTVDTLGNVKDVEILRGLSKEIDEECLRVVKMLKYKTPGSLYGKLIEVAYKFPIVFKH